MARHPEIDFRIVFNAHPGASALVLSDGPEFTIVASTDEFAQFARTAKADLIGQSLFKHFPDNPDSPNVSTDVRLSLQRCIAQKTVSELEIQRYDIRDTDGSFREMYWTVRHTPILDDSGEVALIIHSAVDVSAKVLSIRKDEMIRALELAKNLFDQSAVAIHIIKGEDQVVEMANEVTLKHWRKDASVIGKSLREVLPEVEYSDYLDTIRTVYQTGVPYEAYDWPVTFSFEGNTVTRYFNFVLQAYYEDDSRPAGVIAISNDVTEVYQDKKMLLDKERSLQMATEIGDLGIFSIDLRSNTVSYSPQIMKWFDVTRLNLPVGELLAKVHPEDFAMVDETLMHTANGRPRRHDITFRVARPQTQEVLYLRSIGQIQEEGGENITLSGIIQDVTPLIISRQAVEQSAQQLRSLIDSAPFPIGVYTGKEMRIEMLNQAILDVWGRDKSVIGNTYYNVLTELEGKGIYENLDRVYETGEAYHASNQRIELLSEGQLKTFYFNYSFTPLFDANGEVYGVMNTAADVTDLNVAQKALAESERNFRTMILTAPVAMCLMRGPSLIIEIANDSMISLWGKDKNSVMNRPYFEALADTRGQGLEEMLSGVYNSGQRFVAQESPITFERNGRKEVAYLNFVCEPYRDGDGNIAGVLGIAIEVTDQVLARQQIEEIVRERTHELADANQRLQNSNAELEQFAYIASHDLQEPLRKINMFAGLLGNALENPNERVRKHLTNISISVQRMTNLIHDILSYSQLSRKHEVFRETSLEEIFNETITDFDLIVEEKQGRITHADLPVIEAIPLQMVQLFHNLISNALKYSNPSIPPEITIDASILSDDERVELGLPLLSQPYCQLVFADNGIGFSAEYEAKIFNIFHRLHGKGQYEGTGIGLAMCKKIVENHNGLIYARGTEGQGATFYIILPLRQA